MIDCHCHVIDPARFPFQPDTRYRPTGQEIAPVDQLLRVMDLQGVSHAVIVATNSGYGTDLSPVLDALAQGQGRFRGIAVVELHVTRAELARLKSAGFVGVAFNTPFHGTAHYAGAAALVQTLAELDMLLDIQVRNDELLALMPLIEGSSVRLVVDHCGRPDPARGLDQPGFQALLALGRTGRAHVKLSGFSQFTTTRYPYPDTHPFVAALLQAFTPNRCVWGSDWPFLRAPERIEYGPLLSLIHDLIPGEADRRRVLWDTPARLFGFAAR